MDNLFAGFTDSYANVSWQRFPGQYTLEKEHLRITLRYPHAYHKADLLQALTSYLQDKLPFVPTITLETKIATHRTQLQQKPKQPIKNIIGVCANKGGVGKSTIAMNLALALAQANLNVGLVDTDLYGPNQPQLLGSNAQATIKDEGYEPIYIHNIHTISMGHLVDKGTPLVWRGPMVSAYMLQLIEKTHWPELDYLIVDLPPGTGDIHLSLCQKIPLSGMCLITLAQKLSLDDTDKGLAMLDKLSITKLGCITNMHGFTCSQCQHHHPLFSEDIDAWLEKTQLPHLGRVGLDSDLAHSAALGQPLMSVTTHPLHATFRQLATKLGAQLALQPLAPRGSFPKIVVQS